MRKFVAGLLYCAMLKVYPLEKEKIGSYWQSQGEQQGMSVLSNFVLILLKNLYEVKKFMLNN